MSQRTIITPDTGGYHRESNFFLQSFYQEGHVVNQDAFFDGAFAGDQEILHNLLKEVFSDSDIVINDYTVIITGPEGAARMDLGRKNPERFSVTDIVYTLTPKRAKAFCDAMVSLERFVPPPRVPNGSFHVKDFFINGMGQLRAQDHHMDSSKMNEIRDDLYPDVNVEKLVESFLDSKENILILVGRPGTGKTTFMKRVLQRMSMKKGSPQSYYTKDTGVLKQSSFWAETLQAGKPSFLVLDDLDRELTPRTEGDGNTIVNQLLSLSNGLFESTMKIIITTNLVDEGIDSAVLRPGRCFDVLNLPYLSREYAKELWTGVDKRTEEEWNNLFPASLENVTQALYMANLESLTMGNTKDYLSNLSISVRDKYL